MMFPPINKARTIIAVVSASLLIVVSILAARELRKGKLARLCSASNDPKYITLTMGECFGPCSVYSLEFRGNGKLKWSGARNVKKIGPLDDSFSPTLFSRVITVLDQSGFADDVDYLSGDTDSQMVSVELRCGTFTKKVKYTNEGVDLPKHLQGLDVKIISTLALSHLVK